MSQLAPTFSAVNEPAIEEIRRGTKGLRLLAGALSVSTLALIALGALVTGFGVGMAVPDWPTTFGENMFTFSMADQHWSVQLEHGHRLAGAFVGLLMLALAVWLWVSDRRPWVRTLGLVGLVMVIVQGILGGMRVVQIDPRWALVHGPLAQVFFALTLVFNLVVPGSARRYQAVPGQRLAWVTAGVVLVQIVTGASLRHLGEGLLLHLFLAFAVLVHLGLLVKKTIADSRLAPWALACAGMGAAQLFLGLFSWMLVHAGSPEGPVRGSSLGAIISSLHVVVGALLLGALVCLAVRASVAPSQAGRETDA